MARSNPYELTLIGGGAIVCSGLMKSITFLAGNDAPVATALNEFCANGAGITGIAAVSAAGIIATRRHIFNRRHAKWVASLG